MNDTELIWKIVGAMAALSIPLGALFIFSVKATINGKIRDAFHEIEATYVRKDILRITLKTLKCPHCNKDVSAAALED
tara:strand:+ start:1477 stop:1710 length:234 start_codon:yes stop_codon:yes gene_type:complete